MTTTTTIDDEDAEKDNNGNNISWCQLTMTGDFVRIVVSQED